MFTRTVSIVALVSALGACSSPANVTNVYQLAADAGASAPVDAPDSALGRSPLADAGEADSAPSSSDDAATIDAGAADSSAPSDAATIDANALPPDSGSTTSTFVYDIQGGATFETHMFTMPAACVIVASGCDVAAGLSLDREYKAPIGNAGGTLQCAVTNHTSAQLTLTMWITCQQ